VSDWTVEFRRTVVAAALRGDLLSTIPLDPEVFAGPDGAAQPPLQRIAQALVEYYDTYRTRPTDAIFSQLVADACERLQDTERAVVTREAEIVASLAPPTDVEFLRNTVKQAVERRAMERAVKEVQRMIDARTFEPDTARELIARAFSPIELNADRRVNYLADAEARLASWRRGDEMGERISTGFPRLDDALRGGPTRREVFYFLAPPKGAKTAALLNVAAAALRRQYGVYVATFEMQAIRMALRVDRLLSRQNRDELFDDQDVLRRALDGLRATGAAELYIDEFPPQMPNSVAEVRRRILEIRRAGGVVDVVILDYLNIMGAARDEREKRHELPRISREISALARELNVLIWCAALVNRAAVNKSVIRKTDIAEAFEVIAVADGVVAICADPDMVRGGTRRFYVAAAREEADEVRAGDYRADFSRMTLTPIDDVIEPAIEPAADSPPQGV
jgi:replicative DNA helicase